jgi:hypothetical protein
MRWARHVAWIGEKRGAYGVIVGKPEGRPRHRWEDNIRMDLKETRWVDMAWIDLDKDKW